MGGSGWTNQVQFLVIVGGTGAGLFVYSGTPSASNPPIFWATSATTDPFGNAIPSTAGVAGTGTFQAGNVITSPSGTVGYSGTPAANNMLYSDAPAAFTDSFGNKVLSGRAVYNVNLALVMIPNSTNFLTYTNSSNQSGTWTAQATFQLPTDSSGQMPAQLQPGALAFQNTGIPLVTNIPAGFAALFCSTSGVMGVAMKDGITGYLPVVQVDTTTNAVGNVITAGDITRAWSIPANDGVAGTTYTIKALITVNTGQTTIQTLTLGVDIGGTKTALATLGTAFNGGALNTVYAVPAELVLIVDNIGTNTPQVYLNAPLGDESANRLSTNSANLQGHSNTTTWNKANANTLAIYAQWGGAGGSSQNAQTTSSRLYREGP